MDRRKFIATAGASIATIGLAGCADPGDGTGTTGDGIVDDTTADDGVGEDTTEGDGEVTTTEGDEETTTTAGDDEETTTDGGTEGTGTEGGVSADDIDGEVGDNVSEHVEVTSHEAFEEGENVGVRGVVENTSDQTLDYVEVEVTLNDGDTVIGEFVDTSDQDVDSLPAGETWEWQVTFDDEELTQNTEYTIEVDAELEDGGTVTETGTTERLVSLLR